MSSKQKHRFDCTKWRDRIIFLRNSIRLSALKKISIFRSRFHSSKAVSDDGAILLEIETPVDKKDLVRLYDEYGRENKGYEGSNSFTSKMMILAFLIQVIQMAKLMRMGHFCNIYKLKIINI